MFQLRLEIINHITDREKKQKLLALLRSGLLEEVE